MPQPAQPRARTTTEHVEGGAVRVTRRRALDALPTTTLGQSRRQEAEDAITEAKALANAFPDREYTVFLLEQSTLVTHNPSSRADRRTAIATVRAVPR